MTLSATLFLFQVFNKDPQLRDMLLEEVLEDALAEDVVAIASVVLEESKYKVKTRIHCFASFLSSYQTTEYMKMHKGTWRLYFFHSLHTHDYSPHKLCSPTLAMQEDEDRRAARLAEEDFIMPEVQRSVYISVWELLYDLGRTLPRDEFMELKNREKDLKLHPVAKQALVAHVLEVSPE